LNAGCWADAQFDAFVAAAATTDMSDLVPGNSLEKRQAFLGAVSDIHITMDLSRSIGPRVMSLGISSADATMSLRD
jgi:hypothetical protein